MRGVHRTSGSIAHTFIEPRYVQGTELRVMGASELMGPNLGSPVYSSVGKDN